MPKVFVSDAVHHERLAFGGRPQPASPAARRWKALSALYQASLVACRFHVEHVLRPEIYQTDVARQVRGVSERDWHLAIKPIEHIRPFHGIPNVFVCDWPFAELSSSRLGGSPFSDHVGLLNKADVVACCTWFTAGTLRDAGVERVVNLPPWIPLPDRVASHGGSLDHCRFLTVADIDRMPGQLEPVIRGFVQAQARHGNLQLTVRVLGGEPRSTAELLHGVLGLAALDGAISFVFDIAVADLLGSADFFLCCDSVAGLSVPMIKAMIAGVPVLATMSSAMGSFLTPDSAVPISSVTVPADEIDEPMARFMKLTCNVSTAEGVRDAILAAVDLDDATRTAMTTTCRAIAERNFGLAAFEAGLVQVEEYLGR